MAHRDPVSGPIELNDPTGVGKGRGGRRFPRFRSLALACAGRERERINRKESGAYRLRGIFANCYQGRDLSVRGRDRKRKRERERRPVQYLMGV